MNSTLAENSGTDSGTGFEQVLERALAFLRAGKTDRALGCLTAGAQLTWNHSFACYLAGLIQVNLGRDAAALPFYGGSLALKPDYAEATEARTRLLQRAEN